MDEVMGGCLCGKVRIVAAGAPYRVGLCHCLDCRKHHGALFYAAAIFPAEAVTVSGETRDYQGRHFCPDCGSDVYYTIVGKFDDLVAIPLGTFDDPHFGTPEYSVWEGRKHEWVEITGEGIDHIG